MLRVLWRNRQLPITRVVLRGDHHDAYSAAVAELAHHFRLAVADDTTPPRAGDFWLGCTPQNGWGAVDQQEIGWASGFEVPVAVFALIRASAAEPDRRQPFGVEPPVLLGAA